MNEEILNLHEAVLDEYIGEMLPKFNERKQEIVIMVTNMPQKHSIVNCITEVLEREYGKEKIVEMEKEILKYACRDYFLLTNALLYFERRWNTKVVRKILRSACNGEQFKALFSLITDPYEDETEGKCNVDMQITIPKDFSKVLKIYKILTQLYEKKIILSVRDSFTAYKIVVAYGSNVDFIADELNMLAHLESVSFEDLLGGVLLGVFLCEKEVPHFSNIIARIIRRNKAYMQYVMQLFVVAYNKKNEIWESIKNVIPYMYVQMGADRKMAHCLLYTLDLKSAVFVYELLDGNVPQIEVFDRCVQGRKSLPDEETRQNVRALLHIPDSETYAMAAPSLCTAPAKQEDKPPTQYSELEDKMLFYSFFIQKGSASHTHANNMALEYTDVIKNLSPEEMDVFIRIILSADNSLVYKELAVHKMYCIRTYGGSSYMCK